MGPLDFVQTIVLVIGLAIAAILVVYGVLAAVDTHNLKATIVVFGIALAVSAGTVAIALFIPGRLLASATCILAGIFEIGLGLSTAYISKPSGVRSRGLYTLANTIGGQGCVHVLYIFLGLLLLGLGLLGLFAFFGWL